MTTASVIPFPKPDHTLKFKLFDTDCPVIKLPRSRKARVTAKDRAFKNAVDAVLAASDRMRRGGKAPLIWKRDVRRSEYSALGGRFVIALLGGRGWAVYEYGKRLTRCPTFYACKKVVEKVLEGDRNFYSK